MIGPNRHQPKEKQKEKTAKRRVWGWCPCVRPWMECRFGTQARQAATAGDHLVLFQYEAQKNVQRLEHREIAFNLPGMNLPAVLAPLDRLRIEESLVDRVPQRLAYQGISAQPFQCLAKCRGQQAGVPL